MEKIEYGIEGNEWNTCVDDIKYIVLRYMSECELDDEFPKWYMSKSLLYKLKILEQENTVDMLNAPEQYWSRFFKFDVVFIEEDEIMFGTDKLKVIVNFQE
jgi:hypothetical protein